MKARSGTLDGVSLTIQRGEFVAIVGQSGSGKSTMMNVLGCLDIPTRGNYLLDGTDVRELTDTELSRIRNKEIGFIFQQYNLIQSLTVLENVADSKYAMVLSCSFQAVLGSEFAPFLRPNQYVDYGGAASTLAKAAELAGGVEGTMGKVEKIYDFVVGNLTYDTQKAANVKSGYLPVLDSVLSSKKESVLTTPPS